MFKLKYSTQEYVTSVEVPFISRGQNGNNFPQKLSQGPQEPFKGTQTLNLGPEGPVQFRM